jgi:DNA modification methylase
MRELNKVYKGLAVETIKTFPDKSINCVITSPPYWQLRDYGFSEQWGLEPTFEQYLEHLWSLMDEIWRVLKDDGTVWINLGDTYGTVSGNMQRGNIIENKIKYTGGIENYTKPNNLHKCLLLIPHRFAIGCIDRGWIMRNDIIWAKRNGMPESVTDRFSKKHEYFFFMAKSKRYYFDLDSIKDKTLTYDAGFRNRDATRLNNTPGRTRMAGLKENKYHAKNPGSVSDFWDIPTKPSSKDHYAAYNDELILKPILSGCPKDGLILDPFAGTGTTLCTAYLKGRNVIGIEGSDSYQKIAQSELDLIIQRSRDIKEYGFSKNEINNDYPTLF